MTSEPDSSKFPQYMSITGKSLDLNGLSESQGHCVPIESFEKLNQLGEGTYGVVHRARDRSTSNIVAIKQVRISATERQNGVHITALREISILRSLKHSNIINVVNVAVGTKDLDEVYMVMEYAEQALEMPFLEGLGPCKHVRRARCEILYERGQLLEGLDYLHKMDIIHRDVKMQNILLTARGVLKLADFGMARAYSRRPLTPGVVTIWYRAPEILLGTKYYTPSIDIWSAGLVLAELLQSTPCLPGETIVDQLSLIVKLIGSPTSDDHAALSALGCPDLIRWRKEGLATGRANNLERRFLSETSQETVEVLQGMLRWDPQARWTAAEALGNGKGSYVMKADRWWRANPRAVQKELLPTYPEIRNKAHIRYHELDVEIDRTDTQDSGGFIFDFEDRTRVQRPSKRPRAR